MANIQYADPAQDAVAVTPSDTTELSPIARSLYIGVEGNIKVTTEAGSDITFVGVTAGSILPVRCRRVFSTGTTATDIIALE